MVEHGTTEVILPEEESDALYLAWAPREVRCRPWVACPFSWEVVPILGGFKGDPRGKVPVKRNTVAPFFGLHF